MGALESPLHRKQREATLESWSIEAVRARLTQLIGESPDLAPAQQRARRRLLDAAREHFARFGYRRANIGDIARDAGLGKGTVYLHFSSKQALLLACGAQEKLRLLPELEGVLELPEADRLEAYLEAYLRFVLIAPISRALLADDTEMGAVLADLETEVGSDVLRQGAEASLARFDDFITHLVPELPEEKRRTLAVVVRTVSRLAAHLPSSEGELGMSIGEFVRVYANILARGVAAHADAVLPTAGGVG